MTDFMDKDSVEIGKSFGRYEATSEAIRAFDEGRIEEWIEYVRPKTFEEWEEYKKEHPEPFWPDNPL